MRQDQIIKFERGTLYLRLRETFDTDRMVVHCTLAEVTRDAVKVVKADSRGEVCSTSMTLSADDFTVLAEGVEKVHAFWHEQALPYQHVLFECGCIQQWDEVPLYEDELPLFGGGGWCNRHEETRIYRFKIDDFIGESGVICSLSS
jgi:hypothetical protein